jgi:hypothetical protein
MKLRLIFVALVVMIVAAACQPPPELRNPEFLSDTSLLTDDPCEAPCWRGITPGETTWREARIIIEDDPALTEPTINDVEEGGQVMVFNYEDGPQCCQIYTEDGESVTQILTLMAPEMTLGQVIDKFGEPEYLSGADVSPTQTMVQLVFPDVPLGLLVFGEGIETGELSADSDVIGAFYLDPADMELLLNANLYYWDGYGPLATILDGNFDIEAEAVDAEGGEAVEEDNAEDTTDDTTSEETATTEAEGEE